jgi:LEA14-like dessication related protein
MMILKLRLWPVILILLLGGGGYLIYFFIQKHKMLNLLVPEVTEITLIKANIRQDTAYIEVNTIVTNKAPYEMNIDSVVCDLAVGGTLLVSTSNYVGLHQQSGQSDSVTFSVKIPISHTRNKIMSLQGQDSTGLSISAVIVYSGMKVPFIKSKKIEVPVPPQFKILKTDKKVKLFKKDIEAQLFLSIINEGKNLSLDLHDLQYEIMIGDDLASKGKFPRDVSIRPQSSQVLKLPMNIKMNHPLETIFKIMGDKDRLPFRIKLSGYLDAGKMKRIPTVIFASGKMELVNEEKKKAEKKREKEKKKERRKDEREDRREARQEKREARKEGE